MTKETSRSKNQCNTMGPQWLKFNLKNKNSNRLEQSYRLIKILFVFNAFDKCFKHFISTCIITNKQRKQQLQQNSFKNYYL